MDMFKIITSLLCGATAVDYTDRDRYLQEKLLRQNPNNTPRTIRSDKEISQQIVHILLTIENNGPALRRELNDVVGAQGWTEAIACSILACLEQVIKEGREKLGQVLNEAIERAENAVNDLFEFSKEHPYLVAGFVTIVAIGILVYMAPWVVEALGFGELGPVAGKSESTFSSVFSSFRCKADWCADSFAARWESAYSGSIPKGSLFGFFQRLGMVWARA